MAVLEAKLIISADDRASAVLKSIEKRIESLGARFKALDRVAGGTGSTRRGAAADNFGRLERAQTKLAGAIDRMAAGVDRLDKAERRRGRRAGAYGDGGGSGGASGGGDHGGFGGFGLRHALGFGAGFEAARAGHEVYKAGAARAHEESRAAGAGMSRAEIDRTRLAVARIAAETPAAGDMAELMHEARNARSVVGNTDEALELMPALAKLRVIAQQQKPGKDIGQDMDYLIKGLEIKGVTQDPKKFLEYMNGVAKGLSVFGDTLSASQYYHMMLFGRQATPMLSEKFMLGTAPTLAQELKGSSYGRAVSAFNKAIVGGTMTPAAARKLQSLGLIGADDLTKGGKLKAGRSVAGWDLAQTDPNEWIKQYLIPTLTAHKITDTGAVAKVIGETFSNQLAAQMVTILATQQPKIDKDTALIAGARGLDGAEEAMRHDPLVANMALVGALHNLAGSVGESVARAMAPIAFDFAKSVNRLNARIEENNQFVKTHGDNVDTPLNKETRRVFNKALFGLDDNRGIGEIDPDTKLQAEFARRRALYRKWHDERETDPRKLAEIAERRKHVAPGFEASAKAQDDADEFPMRAAAEENLRRLEMEERQYKLMRDKMSAERDRLARITAMGPHAPGPDASPYLTNQADPDRPLGVGVFPLTKRMRHFGEFGGGGAPGEPVAPPAPVAPPPPQPVTIEGLLKVGATGEVPIRVVPNEKFTITAPQVVGLRAEIEKVVQSGGGAPTGKSLPEASPRGASGAH